jgi:hypothetical protein
MRVHPVIEWHYAEVWAVSEPACFDLTNYSSFDSHLVFIDGKRKQLTKDRMAA